MTTVPCSTSRTAKRIALRSGQRRSVPIDGVAHDRQVRAGTFRGEVEEGVAARKDLDQVDLIAEGQEDVLQRGLEAQGLHDFEFLLHQLAVVGAGNGEIESGATRLCGV